MKGLEIWFHYLHFTYFMLQSSMLTHHTSLKLKLVIQYGNNFSEFYLKLNNLVF